MTAPDRFRTPTRRGPRACALLLAVLVALVARHLAPAPVEPGAPVAVAWWFWVPILAEWIWKGLEIAGKITLNALAWAVRALQIVATKAYNFGLELGRDTITAFRKAWQALRRVYTDVLRRGWTKFWWLVDRVRTTLDRVLGPVFHILQAIRKQILDFYNYWVRPILDTIDVTRRILGILKRLGVEWAAALDAKLGSIESWIDEQFQRVLGEINKVINTVNRIATFDGLLQRLALVRSITRDFHVIGEEYARWHKPAATPGELDQWGKRKVPPIDGRALGAELGTFYRREDSAFSAIVHELAHEWRAAAGIKVP